MKELNDAQTLALNLLPRKIQKLHTCTWKIDEAWSQSFSPPSKNRLAPLLSQPHLNFEFKERETWCKNEEFELHWSLYKILGEMTLLSLDLWWPLTLQCDSFLSIFFTICFLFYLYACCYDIVLIFIFISINLLILLYKCVSACHHHSRTKLAFTYSFLHKKVAIIYQQITNIHWVPIKESKVWHQRCCLTKWIKTLKRY